MGHGIRGAVSRRVEEIGLVGLLLVASLLWLAAGARAAAPRVRIQTTAGSFVVELYADRAPRTVERFLARADLGPKPEGIAGIVPYAGLVLCESRAHGYLVLGCLPFEPTAGELPRSPGKEPPLEDEIDAAAMGLAERKIGGVAERDWLWQQEIFPRTWKLEETGRPVPPGLRALVEAVQREGTGAMTRLDRMSRLAYLEALGYRFSAGASPHRMSRGSLATANLWPGEADERFLLALADLPERDGRATVFGRVLEGWDTLDRIAGIAVDKGHRPRTPVSIQGMEFAE